MSWTDPIWITDNEALASACQGWNEQAVLALDTEFMRTDTYHAVLGLVQIADASHVWLIDPLTITDWQPFAKVLSNASVRKVLHALSEDAEVLLQSVGVAIENVFDTQIAASLLGQPVQMGFSKLVAHFCGEDLPSDATRSDWIQRPLSEDQLRYAVDDVVWLYQAYQTLMAEPVLQQREAWVLEDSARLASQAEPTDPEVYYQKLRGAWKLKGGRLTALQKLCAWREKNARELNVNRGRVLTDKELIGMAERMPKNKSDLQRQFKLPSRKIRLYGDQILDLIKAGDEARREAWPDRIEAPLPADQAELLKKVRQCVTQQAEALGIAPEVMARRKQIEAWLRSGSRGGESKIPEALSGWRHAYLAEPITQLITEFRESVHES